MDRGAGQIWHTSLLQKIIEGKVLQIYNNGNMSRDFTYITDIVDGIVSVMNYVPKNNPPHSIYNLGNSLAENLLDFVNILSNTLEIKANIEYLPMQLGDVKDTFADIELSEKDFGFSPKITIFDGIPEFVDWYVDYYGK